MGKYTRCRKSSMQIARLVLMRYPETVKELQTDQIRDAYNRRLQREAEAVELALSDLDECQLDVIRLRFWNHLPGVTKVNPYYHLSDVPYSDRTMRRITQKVLCRIAYNLGETRTDPEG